MRLFAPAAGFPPVDHVTRTRRISRRRAGPASSISVYRKADRVGDASFSSSRLDARLNNVKNDDVAKESWKGILTRRGYSLAFSYLTFFPILSCLPVVGGNKLSVLICQEN